MEENEKVFVEDLKRMKEINLSNDLKKKFFEIGKNYYNKKSLKNLKFEVNCSKIGIEFVETIQPFLKYLSRDSNLEEIFREVLNDERLNEKLQEFVVEFREIDTESGKDFYSNEMQRVILPNLALIRSIYNLIFEFNFSQKDEDVNDTDY